MLFLDHKYRYGVLDTPDAMAPFVALGFPSQLDLPVRKNRSEPLHSPIVSNPSLLQDCQAANTEDTIYFTSQDQSAEVFRVGDVIEPFIMEKWPEGVILVARNVFDVSRPFPIAASITEESDRCGCQGGKCTLEADRPYINIATYNICESWNCSAGVGCGNRFEQSFQLHLVMTPIRYGIVTENYIRAGDFIIEYTGEVIYGSDAQARSDKRYMVQLPQGASAVNEVIYIDAQHCGNASRFINHSCNPNCEMYACNWANTIRLGISARRDIDSFTELCFSYGKGNLELFSCCCGAERCTSRK